MTLIELIRQYVRRNLCQDAFAAVDQGMIGEGAGDAALRYPLLTIHVTNADGVPVKTADNRYVRA